MEKHGTFNNNWSTHFLHTKGYEKLDKLNLVKGDNTVALCITAILLTALIAIGWYNIHDRSLMADNINRAVEKGIDPLSVRCSYVQSQDIICIAFAASAQSHNVAQQATSKK